MAIHKIKGRAQIDKLPVGVHHDGGCLALQISASTDGTNLNRSWLFIYSLRDPSRRSGWRQRSMGLGSLNTLDLEMARAAALECRKLRLAGLDPLDERNRKRAADAARAQKEAARKRTFDQCSHAYVAAHREQWKSQKHVGQWVTTLATYASPVLGNTSIADIDLPMVLKVLEPIWAEKQETASRLRGRIEAILDYAATRGYRPTGDNPARWSGHLEHLLAGRTRAAKHLVAMAYSEVPALMAKLRAQPEGSVNERALEFVVLTAARRGEVLGATWDEVDFAKRTWTIPAARMKAGKPHRVPLSPRAIAILNEMLQFRRSDVVFAGSRRDRITDHVLLGLLRRTGIEHATVHGFRSAFADWCREQTNTPREIAEQALAHHVGNAVERSYARTDVFDKRAALMTKWAAFCGGEVSKAAPKKAAERKIIAITEGHRPKRQQRARAR
jgi:integrase